MRLSRRIWPALLPLLLAVGVVAGTCGFPGRASINAASVRKHVRRGDAALSAGPLGRLTTSTFRKKITVQSFDSGRATVNVTPTFDGLGMLGVTRNNTLFAIQRRGTSSIDPTGQIAMFEFRGPETGWIARPIYDSEWDDRNAAGGVTPGGAMMSFLARYDSNTGRWIDMGYIRSIDDGQTWSNYRKLPVGSDRWFSPYGPLIPLPSGRLVQLFYGNNGYTYRLRAMFSDDDGISWQGESIIDQSSYERPTEAAGIFVSGTTDQNSKIIVVARTEPGPHPKARGGLMQYSSADGGRRWKREGFMNVGNTPSDISPWMTRLSDNRIALVWAARRSMTIEVATADAERVFANRKGWRKPYTLFTSRLADQRPRQAANFGYPAIAHIGADDEDAVVVFFDANANDPSVFHEKTLANTDLVMIRLLGPRIAEKRRLARLNSTTST